MRIVRARPTRREAVAPSSIPVVPEGSPPEPGAEPLGPDAVHPGKGRFRSGEDPGGVLPAPAQESPENAGKERPRQPRPPEIGQEVPPLDGILGMRGLDRWTRLVRGEGPWKCEVDRPGSGMLG